MRRLAAALALAAAVPLAGCGGDGRPAADPTSAPTPRPVSLARAGGIAGIQEKVTVDPGGSWRHTERRRETSGTLSADQLDRLTRMAADPALAAEADRPVRTIHCADGYDLALTVGGTTVRWQECGPEADVPPVSARIARLILDSID